MAGTSSQDKVVLVSGASSGLGREAKSTAKRAVKKRATKRHAPPSPPPPDAEHLREVRTRLLAWYDKYKRDLPWRRTRDAYAIWLSEVMLQQTQVSTVIPYWERFLDRFPTVRALAEAPLPEVLAGWKGLGYYTRARNLHRAAQEVVAHHGGRLPGTAAELLELPGFGRYTAGAVASIAYGEPAPLVDGNVARVLSRIFEVEGLPGDKEREARLWALAEALVRGERPGDFNQALMEHGAMQCRPESPPCLLCPVRESCGAFRHGRVHELPPARVRAAPRAMTLALAVWAHEGRLLLARRAEKGLFGGLWELPAAEARADTSAEESTARLAEVLGVKLSLQGALGTVRRQLTHRDLTLKLLRVHGARRPTQAEAFRELRWCTLEEAQGLGMSTAMHKALEAAVAAGALR